MANQNRRKPEVNNSICRGLWIPQEIMSIAAERLSWLGKMVCGRIGSYGAKGCYESNATMGRYFGASLRRIVFAMEQIRSLPLTYSIKVRGRPTCYWLRCSAEVQAAEYLTFRGLSMPNPAYDQRKYCAGGAPKTAQVPTSKTAHNLQTTNKTTGAASPLPADGQAQRRQKEEAKHRKLIQSQLRAKIAERMPSLIPREKGAFMQRFELVAAIVQRGKELVADGKSIDEAAETAYNEIGCPVSRKGA
ncbi:hypothetical protein ES708_17427 [subsurface metagenome]